MDFGNRMIILIVEVNYVCASLWICWNVVIINFVFDNDTANHITIVHNFQNALLIDIVLQLLYNFIISFSNIHCKEVSEQILSLNKYAGLEKYL